MSRKRQPSTSTKAVAAAAVKIASDKLEASDLAVARYRAAVAALDQAGREAYEEAIAAEQAAMAAEIAAITAIEGARKAILAETARPWWTFSWLTWRWRRATFDQVVSRAEEIQRKAAGASAAARDARERAAAAIQLRRSDCEMASQEASLRCAETTSFVQATDVALAALDTAVTDTARQRRMTKDEANRKAMSLVEADPQFIHKSQREWAELIGCSDGLVTDLPFWQRVMETTGRGRKGKAPKTVTLTEKVLAVTENSDEQLQRLIAEQEADSEPSPLAESGKARKIKKRL